MISKVLFTSEEAKRNKMHTCQPPDYKNLETSINRSYINTTSQEPMRGVPSNAGFKASVGGFRLYSLNIYQLDCSVYVLRSKIAQIRTLHPLLVWVSFLKSI